MVNNSPVPDHSFAAISKPTIEHIYADNRLLAIIVSRKYEPGETEFVTASDLNMQVGFVKYPAGGRVQDHEHRPLERHLVGTCEVVLVRSGKTEVSLYNPERRLVAQRLLEAGDLLFIVNGGHGFRMLADTVLLEVKQGPYTGLDEKVRYEP
jgi:hypothetical protein